MRRSSALLLLAVMLGCGQGSSQKVRESAARALLDKARAEHADVCSPKALALAEAHEDFARLENQQGNFLRAAEHLAIAETNAKKALRDSVGCQSRDIAVKGPEDRDQDLIPDLADACPDDPEDKDSFKDEDGCPELDNDLDKFADKDDKCPNDPEDYDSFEDKDGCPELDNDLDKIADKDDKCPIDPEDYDAFQDGDGCPELDNDLDKIADKVDKCPIEPESYNDFQDDDGCPDFKLITVTESKIELSQKIFFAKAQSTILSKSFPLLNEVYLALNASEKILVRIEGHTSSEGNDDYNLKLSQGRADAVRKYLIDKGIKPERLTAIGYGETTPIDTNDNETGREKNRRVEFFIISQ